MTGLEYDGINLIPNREGWLSLSNLDHAVGELVGRLPDGAEYREVLGTAGPGATHVTPDGRVWTAVHEDLTGAAVNASPSILRWKGRAAAAPGGQLDPKSLIAELVTRLGGRPADGSRLIPTNTSFQVVWVDAGDEVLVHLESIAVRIGARNLLISVDLETDQTGRQPLIVSFALSTGSDAAGLVAVTDDLPRGNGILAARWGRILQNALWACLLGIGQDHGASQNGVPRAFTIANGLLNIQPGPPLSVPPSAAGGPA